MCIKGKIAVKLWQYSEAQKEAGCMIPENSETFS